MAWFGSDTSNRLDVNLHIVFGQYCFHSFLLLQQHHFWFVLSGLFRREISGHIHSAFWWHVLSWGNNSLVQNLLCKTYLRKYLQNYIWYLFMRCTKKCKMCHPTICLGPIKIHNTHSESHIWYEQYLLKKRRDGKLFVGILFPFFFYG